MLKGSIGYIVQGGVTFYGIKWWAGQCWNCDDPCYYWSSTGTDIHAFTAGVYSARVRFILKSMYLKYFTCISKNPVLLVPISPCRRQKLRPDCHQVFECESILECCFGNQTSFCIHWSETDREILISGWFERCQAPTRLIHSWPVFAAG